MLCFRLCFFSTLFWLFGCFCGSIKILGLFFSMWKMPLDHLLSTQHHCNLLLSSLLYQRREAESGTFFHRVVLGLNLPMRETQTGYVRQKIRIGYYDSVAVAVGLYRLCSKLLRATLFADVDWKTWWQIVKNSRGFSVSPYELWGFRLRMSVWFLWPLLPRHFHLLGKYQISSIRSISFWNT